MKYIPKFLAADGAAVEFFPDSNVPGYTHRVVINGKATRHWLGHGRPSAKAAEFFLELHRKEASAPPREDPPAPALRFSNAC